MNSLSDKEPTLSGKEKALEVRISNVLKDLKEVNEDSGMQNICDTLEEIQKVIEQSNQTKFDHTIVHRIAIQKIESRFQERVEKLFEEKYRLLKLLDSGIGQMKLL